MDERFSDFQQKRLEIFRELVKKSWNDNLNTESISSIIQSLSNKYNFRNEDASFIKDHIRVAMGLDPMGDVEFSNEITIAKNLDKIQNPIVTKIDGVCHYCDKEHEKNKCFNSCKYEAHMYKRNVGPVIVNNKCLSCGECVTSCSFGAIADKMEFIPLINSLKDKDTPVYATVAPSIVGQFGERITMGQLRTAFRLIGFKDMIEVALFADILTIKEAFEFNHLVRAKDDFFLTSCCCPVWLNLTKKHYPKLFEQMSPSVSPMIASGRILKTFYNDAKVVFIGPCIAKKAEAKEPILKDAVDFVLTFSELKEIFDALEINIEELPGDEKDQASFGGRVYARTGGVSFSVKTAVNRIAPKRLIKFKPKKVDGVKECKKVLDDLSNNVEINYNFIEGMGCEGGCVGGPRTNIDMEKATDLVNEFGEDSLIMTPFDNVNVMKILKELGLKGIDKIIEENKVSNLLARKD